MPTYSSRDPPNAARLIWQSVHDLSVSWQTPVAFPGVRNQNALLGNASAEAMQLYDSCHNGGV